MRRNGRRPPKQALRPRLCGLRARLGCTALLRHTGAAGSLVPHRGKLRLSHIHSTLARDIRYLHLRPQCRPRAVRRAGAVHRARAAPAHLQQPKGYGQPGGHQPRHGEYFRGLTWLHPPGAYHQARPEGILPQCQPRLHGAVRANEHLELRGDITSTKVGHVLCVDRVRQPELLAHRYMRWCRCC